MSRGAASPARPHTLTWVGAGMVAAAGIVHLTILFYIFASRMAYPLDLEWMEGGMLCHALRIMEGRQLYAPPSADFISYLYTPGYPAVVALLGKVFGLSYALGRAVSIASFGGVLAFAFLAVRREAGGGRQGSLWALGALGLIASSFQFTGAWYDLVRNDSLFLVLITAALYLIRYHHRRWPLLVTAGVLAGLAFLTKQTASLFIILAGLAMLVMNWRRLPALVAVVGAVAGGAVLLLNHLSDGWFWRYTFEMHQGHDLYLERIWPETELKLLGFFPAVGAVMMLWVVIAIGGMIRRRAATAQDRSLLFWLAVALTGVGVSAVGFATQWASYNAYIPGLIFPSIFAAMAGADLSRRWGSSGRRAAVSVAMAMAVGGGLTAQLLHQRYEAAPHIPDETDRRTGAELIELLRKIDGPVMMPYHPYYPVLAGKRPTYPQMGINDVTRAGYPFPSQIMNRVAEKYYGAVILDNPPQGRYDFMLGSYKLGGYFRWREVPRVVTGYAVRPTYLFVPRGPTPVPAGARRVNGFEDGTFDGWKKKGAAFGDRPSRGAIWNQGPVGPFEGEYIANSFHGGDGSKGRLLGPPFAVDRPVLEYRAGGGRRPGELAIRLIVDGEVVHRATGTGSDIMELRRVDVRRHLGKNMRVELVDSAAGAWGHLLFDDLMLRTH